MNTRLLILMFFLFISKNSFSQDLPNITPPSPTAYELGKFGQIPIGMFTGTPQMDIPLYTYQTKNLSVPISVNYSSNGIKVDQLSTNVGLGWNLNIGGVITRIVRDKSDENNDYLYPEDEIHNVGLTSPIALDFFFAGGGDDDIDTETDLFMYNFMGYSGGFVMDNDNSIILVPNKDIKVTGYTEGVKTGFLIIAPDGVNYIFLEEEINKNALSGGGSHPVPQFNTTAWYLTKIIHPQGDIIEFVYESEGYNYVTSKSESITVATPTYQNGCPGNPGTGPGYTLSPVITNTLHVTGKKLIEIKSNDDITGSVFINSNTSHPEISAYKLVTDIVVKDDSNAIIERFDFDYLTTSNDRIFLEDISFKDTSKKYEFEYIDPSGLPSRLSKAQDYWGYYNGKTSNTRYFPNPQDLQFIPNELSIHNIGADKSVNAVYAEKGLLKKIFYPTQGHNEFVYESNSYWGEETIQPSQENFSLHAITAEGEFGSSYDAVGTTNTVLHNHTASLTAYASFNSQGGCSSDPLKSKALITITDDQTGNPIAIKERTQNGYTSIGNSLLIEYNSSNNQYYVDLVQNHSYTLRLHPSFECTKADLYLDYYDEVPTNQFSNLISGGLRIKEVKSYTDASNIANTTRYYYGNKEAINESSGDPGKTAYYLSKSTNRSACGLPGEYVDTFFTTLNSSSLRPLFNSSSNGTTYYKYVTVSYGGNNFENGGEENEFIIHNDSPGNPLKGDPIESSTWTNLGWSNGMLKKKTVFKKDQSNSIVLLKQTINNYIEDNRYFEKVYGYTINKKFELPQYDDITYECTASDLTKVWVRRYCTASHKHFYFTVSSKNCIASGNNNVSENWYHDCYGKTVGYIITHPEYLENLDITEYSTNSYWYYLDSTIEKQYDLNGQNPVETSTNYFYGNPDHLQVTRTHSVVSDAKPIITETFYPDDVEFTNSLGYDNLSSPEKAAIDKLKKANLHHIGTPVQVNTYKDLDNDGDLETSELISSQRTNFKEWNTDLVLPEFVQTLKGAYNSSTNPLKDRIQFTYYTDNGNIKETLKTDGTSAIYVWGYDKQYPIAKIENATFLSGQSNTVTASQQTLINNAVSATTGETTISTENTLRTKLQLLREGFSNALVTTYTYDPLIGVTSMTDPKGYTIYYEYDNYNRLEQIKDADGNIVTENKYHYRGQ